MAYVWKKEKAITDYRFSCIRRTSYIYPKEGKFLAYGDKKLDTQLSFEKIHSPTTCVFMNFTSK